MAISQEKIKQWNDYFNSLSPEGKRIAIASDTIEQIKVGTYIPSKGTYLDFNTECDKTEDIQSNFDKVTCNCCLLGGLLATSIKYTNNYKFNDFMYGYSRKMTSTLSQFFTEKQLVLMEAAFEMWDSSKLIGFDDYEEESLIDGAYSERTTDDIGVTSEEINAAYIFGCKFETSNERLAAILQNLIDNKGEFNF